jgi:hypothetical protein
MADIDDDFPNECIFYSREFLHPQAVPWVPRSSFAVMALMSFGIGANDAANS